MKKYLVTGGAGFIGSHLCEKLLKNGFEVVCLDNFYSGNLNNIRGLFNYERFQFVEGDILDVPLVKELASSCDHIFHLAAQIHVERSIIRPGQTVEINLHGTRNLLDVCRHNKSISMTMASSAEVYGEGEHSEISPLNPQSPYAASKCAAEALCIAYFHTYGTNVRVIRNFNTFGPRQRSSGYGAAIAIFTKRAVEGKPIIIYGDGEQTRDYQYIYDAVDGYTLSEKIPAGVIVNTGSGEDHTIKEIAQTIVNITKSSSQLVFVEDRPGEVRKLKSHIDKIKQHGHRPQYSLKEGLVDFAQWYTRYDLDSLGEMT